MPFIVPFIPAIIGGITAGMSMAGVGQPSPHEQQAAMEKQQRDAAAQADQQQAKAAQQAARQYAPNIQSQLGGAVSPDYYTQVAAAQTGYGDQLGAVRSALAMQGIAPPQGGYSNLTASPFAANQPMGGSGGSIPDLNTFLQQQGGFHGA